MKKVILKFKTKVKPETVKLLAEDLKRQWDEGFMLVPDNFMVQLVDEDWKIVEEYLPQTNDMVLVWIEYQDGGNICQTYGFGRYEKDGWIVYLQQAKKVLAWMSLPDPYKS